MNRRQFLACSLSGAVASAALPWDPFIEWCKRWLGFVRKSAKSMLTTFSELLKERYDDTEITGLVYGDRPMFGMVLGA